MSTQIASLPEPINALISEIERKEQAHEEQRRITREETQATLRGLIAEAFGSLWRVFEPHIAREEFKEELLSIYFAPEAIGLAPFGVCLREGHGSGGVCVFVPGSHNQRDRAYVSEKDGFAVFLRERNKALPRILKARHESEVEAACKSLAEAGDGEAAHTALARLIDLEPAKAADWRALFDDWRRERERRREEAEETRRREEAIRQARDEYRAAYAAWKEQREAVRERNRKKAVEAQAALDKPFTVWQLTYALVAETEDGYREIDTAAVYAIEPVPDSKDFWRVIEGGGVRARRFFHPVSLSGRIETRPTERLCSASLWLPETGESIYFQPHLSADEVAINLCLEPMPEMPPAPDALSVYDVRAIREEIEGELYF